jgi:hypothetical protein
MDFGRRRLWAQCRPQPTPSPTSPNPPSPSTPSTLLTSTCTLSIARFWQNLQDYTLTNPDPPIDWTFKVTPNHPFLCIQHGILTLSPPSSPPLPPPSNSRTLNSPSSSPLPP